MTVVTILDASVLDALGEVADAISLAVLAFGALLCLSSGIGALRMKTLFQRQHAIAKPPVLGVLLVLIGVALRVRTGFEMGMLLVVGFFQLLTVPVSAHMITRAAYRALPPGAKRDDTGQHDGTT